MLIPGQIPEQEPEINVGIILPEDLITQISIQVPATKSYFLQIDDSISKIPVKEDLEIILKNDFLQISSNNIQEACKELLLIPDSKEKAIAHKMG
jgi:hypothetical protein